MPFIVRFEPRPGCEGGVSWSPARRRRPSRAEPACLGFQVFVAIRTPIRFAIHSEWYDETAFERRATLPRTRRFPCKGESLLTHEIHGLRRQAAVVVEIEEVSDLTPGSGARRRLDEPTAPAARAPL